MNILRPPENATVDQVSLGVELLDDQACDYLIAASILCDNKLSMPEFQFELKEGGTLVRIPLPAS